ncbi:RNA polymerase sigma factor [Sphingomonas psychrotolerans]|uniref:RNA polymerase subunit sigma-24 n=1 Tax=Sphingomonas psychrotolerans TaxID=1327635 RepID=A0A2K8MN98_9SPHN|nr:sigma-70 family RNA polymerase sigma factor [Sphingomonas psychrotolerans]ATY34196.1 RNA polymerase subunit sigma-24 [Sphingomonas psychrotolerans]
MMADSARGSLIRALLAGYSALRTRLARKVGPELAEDALQETWIRLETRGELAPVKDPQAYLYRAALNAASNMIRAERRHLTIVEIEELLDVADDAPGPGTIAEDRASIAIVEQALSELTERQRIIFQEAFLGDTSHHALAERFGVTLRTVQKELRRGVDLSARRLGRKKSFVTGVPQLSVDKEGEE